MDARSFITLHNIIRKFCKIFTSHKFSPHIRNCYFIRVDKVKNFVLITIDK